MVLVSFCVIEQCSIPAYCKFLLSSGSVSLISGLANWLVRGGKNIISYHDNLVWLMQLATAYHLTTANVLPCIAEVTITYLFVYFC